MDDAVAEIDSVVVVSSVVEAIVVFADLLLVVYWQAMVRYEEIRRFVFGFGAVD